MGAARKKRELPIKFEDPTPKAQEDRHLYEAGPGDTVIPQDRCVDEFHREENRYKSWVGQSVVKSVASKLMIRSGMRDDKRWAKAFQAYCFGKPWEFDHLLDEMLAEYVSIRKR